MCTEYVAQRGSLVKTFERQDDRVPDSSSTTVSVQDAFVGFLLRWVQTGRENGHHAAPTAGQHSPGEFRAGFRFRSRLASRKLGSFQSYVIGKQLPATLTARYTIHVCKR